MKRTLAALLAHAAVGTTRRTDHQAGEMNPVAPLHGMVSPTVTVNSTINEGLTLNGFHPGGPRRRSSSWTWRRRVSS